MAAAAAAAESSRRRRIGIVGYGKLGQFLAKAVLADDSLELCFVWNRSPVEDPSVAGCVLDDLTAFASRKPDLVVEVAHPIITKTYGTLFLQHADYMIGSPTALADAEVEAALTAAAREPNGHGLFIPTGALCAADDIQKMADLGTLEGLKITMKKHPSSLKLNGPPAEKNAAVTDKSGAVVLYSGPVRDLCTYAPNNVNTMAAACMAAHNLGFDRVVGELVADTSLDAHIIDIEVCGPGDFRIDIRRYNPAAVGAVTGNATYNSFLASLRRSRPRGDGVHFC